MTAPEAHPLLAPAPGARLDRLDALRGAAVLWMAGFHFCFDLNWYRLLTPVQAFTRDPFWTVQRTCIVTLFLLVAGIAQAAAMRGWGESPPPLAARFGWQANRAFWRRWLQVAGCAALVSLGSWITFPQSFIYFGVLHGLVVMLLLLRAVAPALPAGAAGLGAGVVLAVACIAAPQLLGFDALNGRLGSVLGLVTVKPLTEDYVPLLPWFGVVLLGWCAGRAWLARGGAWLAGPLPRALRPLAVLGLWSLSFYMLHQPVFIGALEAGRWLGWW